MTSERKKRTLEAAKIAARLRDVLEAKQRLEREEEALTVAAEALAEEPRKFTECLLVLENLPGIMGVAESAHCSECGGVSRGWEPSWKGCPLCLSRAQNTKRESVPGELANRRFVQDAADYVLKS